MCEIIMITGGDTFSSREIDEFNKKATFYDYVYADGDKVEKRIVNFNKIYYETLFNYTYKNGNFYEKATLNRSYGVFNYYDFKFSNGDEFEHKYIDTKKRICIYYNFYLKMKNKKYDELTINQLLKIKGEIYNEQQMNDYNIFRDHSLFL